MKEYETKTTRRIGKAAIFIMAGIGTLMFMTLVFIICFAVHLLQMAGL